MAVGARRGHLEAHGMTIAALAEILAKNLDRPVADATGIKGGYEIMLDWEPDNSPDGPGTGTSIFAAIQEQLGLKLEAQKLRSKF